MNEEEKKAIAKIKFFYICMIDYSRVTNTMNVSNITEISRNVGILLNLIEKQQGEIEHYKNKYEQEQMKEQDMINQIQQLEEEAREIELQNLED